MNTLRNLSIAIALIFSLNIAFADIEPKVTSKDLLGTPTLTRISGETAEYIDTAGRLVTINFNADSSDPSSVTYGDTIGTYGDESYTGTVDITANVKSGYSLDEVDTVSELIDLLNTLDGDDKTALLALINEKNGSNITSFDDLSNYTDIGVLVDFIGVGALDALRDNAMYSVIVKYDISTDSNGDISYAAYYYEIEMDDRYYGSGVSEGNTTGAESITYYWQENGSLTTVYSDYEAFTVYYNGTNDASSSYYVGQTSANNGGIITNTSTSTSDYSITATFIKNTSSGYAGAIHNQGTITSITGDFIANTVTSVSDDDGKGGAIFNTTTSAEISTIMGDFIGNSTVSGGAIANTQGAEIGTIIGNFIANYATYNNSNGGGQGGAIYNAYSGSEIETIIGDFIGNYASSQGGAIYNASEGTIDTIIGDFIENYAGNFGGAIYNAGTIGVIVGDFIRNSSNSSGGVIYNSSNISMLMGDFIENSAATSGGAIYNGGLITEINGDFSYNSAVDSFGGAIYNASFGTINTITGTFSYNTAAKSGGAICNYNSTKIGYIIADFIANSSANGGAIWNNATIDSISGNFTSNYASSTGGAIYNTGESSTITFTAEKGEAYFYIGNYAGELSDGVYDDSAGGFLYIDSGTVNFSGEGDFTVGKAGVEGYDSIASTSDTDTEINKTGTGTLTVNSSMYYYYGALNVKAGSFVYNNESAFGGTLTVGTSGETTTLSTDPTATFQAAASAVGSNEITVKADALLSLSGSDDDKAYDTLSATISGAGTTEISLGYVSATSSIKTYTLSILANATLKIDADDILSTTITNAGTITLTGGTLTKAITDAGSTDKVGTVNISTDTGEFTTISAAISASAVNILGKVILTSNYAITSATLTVASSASLSANVAGLIVDSITTDGDLILVGGTISSSLTDSTLVITSGETGNGTLTITGTTTGNLTVLADSKGEGLASVEVDAVVGTTSITGDSGTTVILGSTDEKSTTVTVDTAASVDITNAGTVTLIDVAETTVNTATEVIMTNAGTQTSLTLDNVATLTAEVTKDSPADATLGTIYSTGEIEINQDEGITKTTAITINANLKSESTVEISNVAEITGDVSGVGYVSITGVQEESKEESDVWVNTTTVQNVSVYDDANADEGSAELVLTNIYSAENLYSDGTIVLHNVDIVANITVEGDLTIDGTDTYVSGKIDAETATKLDVLHVEDDAEIYINEVTDYIEIGTVDKGSSITVYEDVKNTTENNNGYAISILDGEGGSLEVVGIVSGDVSINQGGTGSDGVAVTAGCGLDSVILGSVDGETTITGYENSEVVIGKAYDYTDDETNADVLASTGKTSGDVTITQAKSVDLTNVGVVELTSVASVEIDTATSVDLTNVATDYSYPTSETETETVTMEISSIKISNVGTESSGAYDGEITVSGAGLSSAGDVIIENTGAIVAGESDGDISTTGTASITLTNVASVGNLNSAYDANLTNATVEGTTTAVDIYIDGSVSLKDEVKSDSLEINTGATLSVDADDLVIGSAIENDGKIELGEGTLSVAITVGNGTDGSIELVGDVSANAEYLGNAVDVTDTYTLTLTGTGTDDSGTVSVSITGAGDVKIGDGTDEAYITIDSNGSITAGSLSISDNATLEVDAEDLDVDVSILDGGTLALGDGTLDSEINDETSATGTLLVDGELESNVDVYVETLDLSDGSTYQADSIYANYYNLGNGAEIEVGILTNIDSISDYGITMTVDSGETASIIGDIASNSPYELNGGGTLELTGSLYTTGTSNEYTVNGDSYGAVTITDSSTLQITGGSITTGYTNANVVSGNWDYGYDSSLSAKDVSAVNIGSGSTLAFIDSGLYDSESAILATDSVALFNNVGTISNDGTITLTYTTALSSYSLIYVADATTSENNGDMYSLYDTLDLSIYDTSGEVYGFFVYDIGTEALVLAYIPTSTFSADGENEEELYEEVYSSGDTELILAVANDGLDAYILHSYSYIAEVDTLLLSNMNFANVNRAREILENAAFEAAQLGSAEISEIGYSKVAQLQSINLLGSKNASNGVPAYDYWSVGSTANIDTILSENSIVGMSLGGAYSRVDGEEGDDASSTAFLLSFYGVYENNGFEAFGNIGYAHFWNKGNKSNVKGEWESNGLNALVGVSYELDTDVENLKIQPLAIFNMVLLYSDDATFTGNTLDVYIDEEVYLSAKVMLGLEFEYNFTTEFKAIVRTMYAYELGDESYDFAYGIGSLSGIDYTGGEAGKHSVVAGLVLGYDFSETCSAYIEYTAYLYENLITHSLNLSLALKF